MATITHTALSPPPRYPQPLRPRFSTNPSQTHGGTTARSRRSTDRSDALGSKQGTEGIKLLPAIPTRPIPAPPIEEPSTTEDVAMSVDPPTPSPAISTNAMSEFPLPPRREQPPIPADSQSGSSSSSHAVSTRQTVRPLPARPGPPKVSPFT